jgi:hypothetical protein
LYVDRDPLTVKPLLLSAKASQATPALVKNQIYCIHRGFKDYLLKAAWAGLNAHSTHTTMDFWANII